MIRFECPECRQPQRIDEEHAGKRVKCRKCGTAMSVPSPDSPRLTSNSSSHEPPRPPEVVIIQQEREVESKPIRRKGFECPYCHTDEYPEVKSKISTAGWVVFVVLLLICFPLCIIALFIKEDYRVCSACGIKLGG